MFKIGVIIESFQLPVKAAVEQAAKLGIQGIQLYATEGEYNADTVTKTNLNALKAQLNDNNMIVSALCGDMGGHGFQIESDNRARVDKSKKIIDMALELGSNVVTTHIGVIPEDKSDPVYKVLLSACREIALYAQMCGAYFAIETGPEKAGVLKSFIDDSETSALSVNFDPANLYMVTHEDVVAAAKLLKNRIVHTHAKDGLRGVKYAPKEVYDFFAKGGIGDLRLNDYFKETPLGEGGVDFDGYLQVLKDSGYTGFLTIECEITTTPQRDIKLAADFLNKKIQGVF